LVLELRKKKGFFIWFYGFLIFVLFKCFLEHLEKLEHEHTTPNKRHSDTDHAVAQNRGDLAPAV
jgi:hypothetical protein